MRLFTLFSLTFYLLIFPIFLSAQVIDCTERGQRAVITSNQNITFFGESSPYSFPSSMRGDYSSLSLQSWGVMALDSDGVPTYLINPNCPAEWISYERRKFPDTDEFMPFVQVENGDQVTWGITADGRLHSWGLEVDEFDAQFPKLKDSPGRSGWLPRNVSEVYSFSDVLTFIRENSRLRIFGETEGSVEVGSVHGIPTYDLREATVFDIDLSRYVYSEIKSTAFFPISGSRNSTVDCDEIALLSIVDVNGRITFIPLNAKFKFPSCSRGVADIDRLDFSVIPRTTEKGRHYWSFAKMLGDSANSQGPQKKVIHAGCGDMVTLSVEGEIMLFERVDLASPCYFGNEPRSIGDWRYIDWEEGQRLYVSGDYFSNPIDGGEGLEWVNLSSSNFEKWSLRDISEYAPHATIVDACAGGFSEWGNFGGKACILVLSDGTILDKGPGMGQGINFPIRAYSPNESPAKFQSIQLKGDESGLWMIDVTLNGMSQEFIFDTGASSVSISKEVFDKLKRTGRINQSDYVTSSNAVIADGSVIETEIYKLSELQIGETLIEDVYIGVSMTYGAPNLIGQSVFQQFNSFSFDNRTGLLRLEN